MIVIYRVRPCSIDVVSLPRAPKKRARPTRHKSENRARPTRQKSENRARRERVNNLSIHLSYDG